MPRLFEGIVSIEELTSKIGFLRECVDLEGEEFRRCVGFEFPESRGESGLFFEGCEEIARVVCDRVVDAPWPSGEIEPGRPEETASPIFDRFEMIEPGLRKGSQARQSGFGPPGCIDEGGRVGSRGRFDDRELQRFLRLEMRGHPGLREAHVFSNPTEGEGRQALRRTQIRRDGQDLPSLSISVSFLRHLQKIYDRLFFSSRKYQLV